LTGCHKEQTSVKEEVKKQETVWQYQNEPYTIAQKKEESVTISADASGKPYKIITEVELKETGDAAVIRDYSLLTDIKNKTGNEEFDQQGKYIYWRNNQEDIHYEGTADQPLPVTVNLTYYLDGQEITPDQIAHKDGKIHIHAEYENQTNIPFTAVTFFMPGENAISNVSINSGSVMEMNDQSIVMGIVFPGLTDLLDLETNEEIDIPETLDLEADAKDFTMSFTATVITNGILEDFDTKDIDEMINQLDEMDNNKKDVKDAVESLSSGISEYGDYLNQYFDGVVKMDEGIQALNTGIKQLKDNSAALSDGTDALYQGIHQLNEAVKNYSLTDEQMIQVQNTLDEIENETKKIEPYLKTLTDNIPNLEKEAEKIQMAVTEFENQTVPQKEKQLTELAQSQARESLRIALQETELSDEEKNTIIEAAVNSISLDGQLENLTQNIQSIFSSLQEQIPALNDVKPDEVISSALKKLAFVEGLLEKYNISDAKEILKQLNNGLKAIDQLDQGSRQLSDGIQAYTDGVAQLSEGMNTLKSGSKTLVDSSSPLKDGINKMKDGADEFSDAIEEFMDDDLIDIKGLGTDDLKRLAEKIKQLKDADIRYQSYSGLEEGQEGKVRFLIETDEIE
ncbi:MAG: hypothetical protein IKR11_00135, partial [Solobacterium sp.]|nr:hypothetical protein [Solobacterium sp.]